jgi:hypothetical protein
MAFLAAHANALEIVEINLHSYISSYICLYISVFTHEHTVLASKATQTQTHG